ncbi:hypothetical protein PENSPDRAFT_646953 [Peniophora sp. CONT]|nr:hypothetical protein PENSPDRAFT_646953 [Peniophora sp. CONT]
MSEQPDILARYASHPFNADGGYQQGLSTILSSGALDQLPEEDRANALRRTRVFYFNQVTGSNISEEDAQRAEQGTGPTSEPGSEPATEETRVLSFAELQELITLGKTDQIPNNKQIPDVLSDATPSNSVEQPRKKPWEK